MSEPTRDPYTGHMTTGHEWNGIIELNTRVPRTLYACLGLAALFSLGYWILMPSFPHGPFGDDYARGRLGFDQRDLVTAQLADGQAPWIERLAGEDFADLQADPGVMATVADVGPPLFRDNCSGCHGATGEGAVGFPSLADGDWIWGDDPGTIARTLEVGINSEHPGHRVAQMLAFGASGLLDASAIENVALYVRSLSDPLVGNGSRAGELLAVRAGKLTYGTTCLGCHGADGEGSEALGAPRLNDDVWLYGGHQEAVVRTITDGRQGWMPGWDGRLSLAQRRLLALYVRTLGPADGKAAATAGGTDGVPGGGA